MMPQKLSPSLALQSTKSVGPGIKLFQHLSVAHEAGQPVLIPNVTAYHQLSMSPTTSVYSGLAKVRLHLSRRWVREHQLCISDAHLPNYGAQNNDCLLNAALTVRRVLDEAPFDNLAELSDPTF